MPPRPTKLQPPPKRNPTLPYLLLLLILSTTPFLVPFLPQNLQSDLLVSWDLFCLSVPFLPYGFYKYLGCTIAPFMDTRDRQERRAEGAMGGKREGGEGVCTVKKKGDWVRTLGFTDGEGGEEVDWHAYPPFREGGKGLEGLVSLEWRESLRSGGSAGGSEPVRTVVGGAADAVEMSQRTRVVGGGGDHSQESRITLTSPPEATSTGTTACNDPTHQHPSQPLNAPFNPPNQPYDDPPHFDRTTCIFCQIADTSFTAHPAFQTRLIYQDDHLLAFADINPSAAHHLLITPRSHILSLFNLTASHLHILNHMKQVGEYILFHELRVDASKKEGYQMGFHVPPFTSVPHLHLHVLVKPFKSVFKRFYNLYFLVGALSVLYGTSSLNPFFQVFPLIVVLAFAAIKDAIEDYSRYLSDTEANNMTARILGRDGDKVDVLAMNIQVGDVIYVRKGEKFPVDAMLLSTNYDDGTCFIETAELDGETNLKRRSAPSALCHLTHAQDLSKLNATILCEQPNENLNTFQGRITYSLAGNPYSSSSHHLNATTATIRKSTLKIPSFASGNTSSIGINPPTATNANVSVLPLTMTNMVLRGAVLRNTDFCWGVVVYTGSNTKIIKNLKRAGLKSSRLEARLNMLVAAAFIYNAILLFGSTVLEYMHYKTVYEVEQASGGKVVVEWYIGAATDPLIKHFFDTLVGFFSLYTYVIPISLFVTIELVRLGQARFMMWDANMTTYRQPLQPSPDGTDEPISMPMRANNSNLNEDLGAVEYIFSDKTGTLTQNQMRLSKWCVNGVIYDDMALPGSLGKTYADPTTPHESKVKLDLFMKAIGLCHSVIPSVDESTGKMVYESQSPDETALLEGLSSNGMRLTFRTKSGMTLTPDLPELPQTFEILQLLEFTSDRKRMSVIVRTPDGELHLYCKGADNVVFSRLSSDPSLNPPAIIGATEEAIQKFSEEGLRTLMVAYCPLTESDYARFKEEFETAERSLVNREESISTACEGVERDMVLLGCTAIEDRLQDEVPETIEYLLRCDIRIWLLTGDKQETAINIGMSSRLISPEMNVLVLIARDEKEVVRVLDELIETLTERADGQSRVTPLQKALVVKLIRTTLKKVTLAIGDGANDVSMIQAADVGVGIMGREGNQATVFESIFFQCYNVVFTSVPPLIIALFEKDLDETSIESYPQVYRQVRRGLFWSWTQSWSYLISAFWHSLVLYFGVTYVLLDGALDPQGRTVGYWVQCYMYCVPVLITVLCKIALVFAPVEEQRTLDLASKLEESTAAQKLALAQKQALEAAQQQEQGSTTTNADDTVDMEVEAKPLTKLEREAVMLTRNQFKRKQKARAKSKARASGTSGTPSGVMKKKRGMKGSRK
ncbi:hypothetical protein HDV05_000313 [Chytridiales sp. JEL 0842]|nr:hypothetical protein HDV05_000313 [Chytridiales sp. JEL 0842]